MISQALSSIVAIAEEFHDVGPEVRNLIACRVHLFQAVIAIQGVGISVITREILSLNKSAGWRVIVEGV